MENAWLLCTSRVVTTSASSGGEDSRRLQKATLKATGKLLENLAWLFLLLVAPAQENTWRPVMEKLFKRGRDKLQSGPKQRLPSATAALSQC